ncbi:MAG: glutaredoxin domain-containing protein [Planctomycetota bacterium]|nr:glutaredoxin domain-containing protein [Planctomycetota bacterium]
MHVVLYTWSTCSFCARARDLLEARGLPYDETPLDGDRAMVTRLTKLFGRACMPFVLVDGEPVGGVDDLEALLEQGKPE